MRLVQWTDDRGYYRLSYLRDDDPDELAPQGVPAGPPDINSLDWEEIKRDIHNLLVSRRLLSWADVQNSQHGVTSVVNAIVKRRLLVLFRTADSGPGGPASANDGE